jgi:hypothetical protein
MSQGVQINNFSFIYLFWGGGIPITRKSYPQTFVMYFKYPIQHIFESIIIMILSHKMWYKINTIVLINGCFHNGPIICPRLVIMAQGRLYWPEATPRANTTFRGPLWLNRGHLTGPLWKHPFLNTFINQSISILGNLHSFWRRPQWTGPLWLLPVHYGLKSHNRPAKHFGAK